MKAKYSKAILKKICALIKKDTYTVAELCVQVGISEGSYYGWKNRFKEFEEQIKEAEDIRLKYFASEAKKSLLKKIQGYTVQEKKTVTVPGKVDEKTGTVTPKIKEQTVTDKHFQPDTGAIIFALCNTDPDNWKNRQSTELTGKDGKDLIPQPDLSKLTDDELRTLVELQSKSGVSKA